MTEIETYTPFKELFKDALMAKNLLAENTCKTCRHCTCQRSRHRNSYIIQHFCENIENININGHIPTTLNSICENWIRADVLSDI